MAKTRARRGRPRVFVASSRANRPVAYAIQQNLDDDADVTVWDQNAFQLTKSTLESLVKIVEESNFGVFVFAPDDVVKVRGERQPAVRDNVLFELGLFMGRLGRERTFVVAPRGVRDLRIPTDLLGITLGRYNPERQDGNTRAAVGPFCSDVREQLRKIGSAGKPQARAPASRLKRRRGDLQVVEALYGVRDHRINVAHKLNSMICRGRLHAYVGNQLGGDPCPGTRKNILVRYTYKGVTKSIVVPERRDLTLPDLAAG